jgi:hypothetical protein
LKLEIRDKSRDRQQLGFKKGIANNLDLKKRSPNEA